jgi:hypothetical protein
MVPMSIRKRTKLRTRINIGQFLYQLRILKIDGINIFTINNYIKLFLSLTKKNQLIQSNYEKTIIIVFINFYFNCI